MKKEPKFANIILIDEKNRVLLQLRDEKEGLLYPGAWCLPGGKIDKGESAKEAAMRECLEETGYILDNPKHFKTIPYPFLDGNPLTAFYTEKYDGKQKIVCNEGQDMVFKDFNQVKDDEFFFGYKELIMDILDISYE